MLEVLRLVVGRGRARWLRLVAIVALPLALVIPGQASARRSAARASAAAACSYVFRDTKADAPDAFSGRQDNNLDIVQGTLGLNRGHTKLRVVMTFKNLSKTIAAPANFLSYLFYWANPAGDSGPNAVEATVDKSGKVTYSDGNVAVVNGNTNYTQSATTAAAGKFGHGPNGALEIDVPLTELHLRLGQALTQEVGSAGSGASSPFGSLSGTADSDGPKGSHKYKLGQPTCIDRERHK